MLDNGIYATYLPVKVLRVSAAVPLPEPATGGAAAVDLRATQSAIVTVGGRSLIPTGLILEIPRGYCGLVLPRSGLAAKHGVTVLNAPGLIDSDYRGEVKVILQNHGDESFAVSLGDRIAQLLIMPFPAIRFEEAQQVSETERGSGGFGSTGVAQ